MSHHNYEPSTLIKIKINYIKINNLKLRDIIAFITWFNVFLYVVIKEICDILGMTNAL